MGRGTAIITAFTAGETSPLTNGRVDNEGYYQACDTLKNMLVNVQGPSEKRPGTSFIASVKDSSDLTRLIMFQYAAGDNYILELGDNYMRFFTLGGAVMSGMVPYEIVTPWQSIDLDYLKVVQSADVMFIVHPLYPPHKLTRLGPTNWTLAAVDFAWGPFLDENETSTTLTPSATTGAAITLTASAALFNLLHVGALWKIVQDYVVSGDMAVLDATVGVITMMAGESFILSLSGAWVATVNLERSFDSGAIWVPYVQFTANATTEIQNLEDNVQYRLKCVAYTSGTVAGRLTIRDKAGYVKIVGFTSATVVTADVVQPLAATTASLKWSEGAFSDYQGYPSAMAFYEQRLLLSGTTMRQSTLWGSYVDDYESFETGPTDSHAYSYTLAGSKVNDILWMLPQKVLFIGTIGDEWKFGFASEPTTNSNVDSKVESEHGSAPVQPLLIEGAPVFVEAGGRALRAIVYSLDEDAFRAPRISEHAEHLLRDVVVDIAFQQQPTPTIWIVRSDGKMVACTFSRSSKVSAYSQHDFGGEVESIAVVRSNDRDELWMVVKRYVDGSYYRYVELMAATTWQDLENAFYVDSGLSYDGSPALTLGGLDHLEGEQVNVLADGAVHRPLTVTGGEITLDNAASIVHAGLSYQSLLKTKRIEFKSQSGTSQGKLKQIYNVVVRLDRTLNCMVGYSVDKLLPVFFRTTSIPLGEPPELFTGDKKLPMIDRGSDDGYVVVANSDPVPFTVVAIIPTLYASEL